MTHAPIDDVARDLNRGVRAKRPRLSAVSDVPFGPRLRVRHFRFGNGLDVLVLVDRSAPIVSYQTWFRVGSRHEQPGKRGLAHLFEHLMFKGTPDNGPGQLDRLLEEAGGDVNAATWTDWTQYYATVPRKAWPLAARLEADRMQNLVLTDAEVAPEKEVVQNERRQTVDDDVDGTVQEKLYATAFRKHPYRFPTIGPMRDIRALSTADCQGFYRTHYAPNNAVIVVAGDVREADALGLIQELYGRMPSARIPAAPKIVEPIQQRERRLTLEQPTDTEKLAVGYKAPAYGDLDHVVLTVANDILCGGRSSRLHRALVMDQELATEVGGGLTPFQEPGLYDLGVQMRPGHRVTKALQELDRQVRRLQREPVTEAELEKAKNRMELAFMSGIETVAGKAEHIGFHAVVVDEPAHGFQRLEAVRAVTAAEVQRAANHFLDRRRRTALRVVPARSGAR